MKFFIFHRPSNAAPGTFGRPKDRAESAQGQSGTLPSTPGDALGTPKAAYEPSKDALKPA